MKSFRANKCMNEAKAVILELEFPKCLRYRKYRHVTLVFQVSLESKYTLGLLLQKPDYLL